MEKSLIWLVVWTPLKNMKVSWDDEIPNIWEHRIHGNKPPTSNLMVLYFSIYLGMTI